TSEEVDAYFGVLIDERTRRPADDVITKFVQHEIDGERLSRQEILDICYLLVAAGLDTVSDSLTCFFAFLARNADHRRRIVDDPSVIPSAVEELLRWETPVPQCTPRLATQDVELPGGEGIAAGTAVSACLGPSNLDPANFEEPFD